MMNLFKQQTPVVEEKKTEKVSDHGCCPVVSENDTSSCPVSHANSALNPLNMMETEEQLSSSSSGRKLSNHRVVSTIPKGEFTPNHQQNNQEKWQYPSEQQYFNAMKRKGWNPQEQDMPSIVAIHNTINEKGWKEVLEYEALHDTGNDPKLYRFIGRPKDISPKARFMSLLGYTLPFDRHDWVVDRSGEHIRYVIDFYSGQPIPGRPLAVYLDVRPALDSFGGLFDRLQMQFHKKILPFLPFGDAFAARKAIESSNTSKSNHCSNTSTNSRAVEDFPPSAISK